MSVHELVTNPCKPKRRRLAKPQRDTNYLCEHAAHLVRSVGFEFAFASRKSIACYYQWPGYDTVLRIADHANDYPPVGHPRVAARLTFSGPFKNRTGVMRISDEKFYQMVAQAIGEYFLRTNGM